MSTSDVPGFNPNNLDTLHAACWAEHQDGTLLYVLGTENGTVLYELFHTGRETVDYRDAMPQKEFERRFSWDPKDPASVKWTWHDKTAFPWDRIKRYFRQGVRPASVRSQIADTEKVKKVRRTYAGTPKAKAKKGAKKSRVRARSARTFDDIIDTAVDTAVDVLIPDNETVAQRIARERNLTARMFEEADIGHMQEREVPKGGLGKRIRDRIQRSINKLRPGRGGG